MLAKFLTQSYMIATQEDETLKFGGGIRYSFTFSSWNPALTAKAVPKETLAWKLQKMNLQYPMGDGFCSAPIKHSCLSPGNRGCSYGPY